MPVAPTIYNRLLLLALAATLPLVALTGYGLYHQFQSDRAHAEHDLLLLRQLNEGNLRNYLDRTREKLTAIARSGAVQSGDRATIETRFREFIAVHPQFANLALLDPAGYVIAAANLRPLNPTTTLAAAEHFREALAADSLYVSRPFIRSIVNEWTCLVSLPVLDPAGRRTGTLVLPLKLPEFTRELALPDTADNYVTGVVDSSGVTMLRLPEPERYIGHPIGAVTTISAQLADTKALLLTQAGLDGLPRTISAARLPGTTWIVYASLPTAEILRDAWTNFWRTLLGVIAIFAAVALLVSRSARAIGRPIAALATAARARTVASPAPAGCPAEIAETVDAYNAMIAARQQAYATLQDHKTWLQSLINTIDGIVWEADAVTLQFTFVSPQALRILGYPVARWLEEKDFWLHHMHPEDRAWAPAYCQNATAQLRDHNFEYRMHAADGREVWLHDIVSLVVEDGRTARLRGVMVDITDRKRAEATRRQMEQKLLETQKLESLGVLAGGIAHDFNNLLTGILGNASLARLDLAGHTRGIEALGQIEKTALRAADLCKQMLAYSGKGRFVVQHLDLNELINDTLQLLQASISKKAVLHPQLTRPLPAISADATQLRQVVMNLVINASEALEERAGTLTLITGTVHVDAAYLAKAHFSVPLTPGPYVSLEVTDTGCGMSRETLARIFDPFFTTKFSGRGLGLAAVHGIVRGHRGAISVHSEPGRGTTFRILLPVSGQPAEDLPRSGSAPAHWRGQGTILIIDDEPSVRQVLESMLQFFGFTAEAAANGQEGVALFARDPARYAAVLLDLTMPHMDGEETFRQLRQLNPAVKVLLMSGFNKQEATSRFIGRGLAGFLQKPFEVPTFVAELRTVLGQ